MEENDKKHESLILLAEHSEFVATYTFAETIDFKQSTPSPPHVHIAENNVETDKRPRARTRAASTDALFVLPAVPKYRWATKAVSARLQKTTLLSLELRWHLHNKRSKINEPATLFLQALCS